MFRRAFIKKKRIQSRKELVLLLNNFNNQWLGELNGL